MNMRKEKPFPSRKVAVIDQLKETISAYPHFYLVDVTALDSVATSELRRKCFKSNIKMVVAKNTLLHKAFEALDVDYSPLYDSLKGTTAIFFTETANVPGKLLQEYASKKKTTPALKAAYAEQGFYVGADQLTVLASIKSKNELIADVIALLQSPIRNIVSALQNKAEKADEAAAETPAAEA